MLSAQGRLYLRHELHLVGFTRGVQEPDENIFCRTGALTSKLHSWLGRRAVRKSRGLDEVALSGELILDKSDIDLHYLLWSLQQTALEAIIRRFLNIVEVHGLHSHVRWQHSKRIGEGWYAEWPNCHRPLSTTWPWNIKPSLLVLWGVCWMFYGPSDNNENRTTRNPRGAAPLSEDLRTGQYGSQSQRRGQIGKSSRQQNHDDLILLTIIF